MRSEKKLQKACPRTRRGAPAATRSGRALVRLAAVLVALALALPLPLVQAGHDGPGTHFGNGNLPAGCTTASDTVTDQGLSMPRFLDGCYHMRTGLNDLDTPIIDVLIVPPASIYPERDARVMRQAIEMWDQGIDHLARQMDLDWLADGVEFNIFLDDDEFTTHPAWDPEIIVVATNPVGGAGIGIDPFGMSGPCKGANPLAPLAAWDALPGFDSHHDGHGGTYQETCEGGGTTCYAVNGAIDPAPGVIDFFGLFDLVAHEVGHCLSVGHVGDALDHKALAVPYPDIMSYTAQSHTKCVSTLDVEAFALRMSRFLLPTPLVANHLNGPGGSFQVQHPDDHRYASPTGEARDCPQPDAGLVPTGPVSFTPASLVPPTVRITTPGALSAGTVPVGGDVDRGDSRAPAESASHADAPDDGTTPATEVLKVDVRLTATALEVDVRVALLWPSTQALSPTSYSAVVDGVAFDSFVRYPHDANPMTWDNGAAAYMPAGSSSWDLEQNVVSFLLPLPHLAAAGLAPPFDVSATANVGGIGTTTPVDAAPDGEPLFIAPLDAAGERVEVLLDGAPAANAAVDTGSGPTASWSADVDLSALDGRRATLTADWYGADGVLLATETLTIEVGTVVDGVVAITTPADGSLGLAGPTTFEGTVTRGTGPTPAGTAERVEVLVDGVPCDAVPVSTSGLGSSSPWSTSCDLGPGGHVVTARWHDADDALLATDSVLHDKTTGVGVTPPTDADQDVDSTATYLFTVADTGGGGGTFELDLDDAAGWARLAGPSTVIVAAGGATAVPVQVAVPDAHRVGTTVTLTATDAADGLVTHAASFAVSSTPSPCAPGVQPFRLDEGTEGFCRIEVAPGAALLHVRMAGPACIAEGAFCEQQDHDLYVRHGALPTDGAYDCRPFQVSNTEECRIDGPAAGTWFVRVHAYQGDGSVDVGAAVDPVLPPCPDAPGAAEACAQTGLGRLAARIVPRDALRSDGLSVVESDVRGNFRFEVDLTAGDGSPWGFTHWRLEVASLDGTSRYAVGSFGDVDLAMPANDGSPGRVVELPGFSLVSADLLQRHAVVTFHVVAGNQEHVLRYSETANAALEAGATPGSEALEAGAGTLVRLEPRRYNPVGAGDATLEGAIA